MPENFKYHSEETRSVFVDGEGRTRKNIVSVDGNSGVKRVEQWSSNGTKMGESEQPLSVEEITNIREKKFMPGLFDAPNAVLGGRRKMRKSRKHRTTRRARKTNRRS